ncbi:hypothetical protein HPP92_006964 [Vanilla planifolia]|uniref:Uncharacterized protein n=1 Tax=Vanilla planifolia TaxID=51239 RepID=A0A835RD60_VANPL|nr:hypothetical protein HPP92_006964 [Vanilla planifolia]
MNCIDIFARSFSRCCWASSLVSPRASSSSSLTRAAFDYPLTVDVYVICRLKAASRIQRIAKTTPDMAAWRVKQTCQLIFSSSPLDSRPTYVSALLAPERVEEWKILLRDYKDCFAWNGTIQKCQAYPQRWPRFTRSIHL